MRRLAAIGCLMITLAPVTSRANGRPPGAISLTVREGHPDDLLFGTTFGLLISHDRGTTWAWLCEAAIGYASYDPVWRYLADGTMLATTYDGLSVSSDGGCQWSFASGTAGRYVGGIAHHPVDANTVLISTWDPSVDTTILRSTDGGHSFPDALYTTTGRYLTDVRIAPSAPQHLYAVSISFTAQSAVVLHSADSGANWDAWPFTLPSGVEIQLLAVHPNDPAVLFVGLYNPNRIARSQDFGQTFVPVADTEGLVHSLVIDPAGSLVWAADSSVGIYRSADGGQSFSLTPASPHGLCLASDGALLYACASSLFDNYVLGRSSDGLTWEPAMRWFDAVGSALGCPAGSVAKENLLCEPAWPALHATFSGKPPGGDADLTVPPKRGCACTSIDSSASLLALLALRRRRRPRLIPPSCR